MVTSLMVSPALGPFGHQGPPHSSKLLDFCLYLDQFFHINELSRLSMKQSKDRISIITCRVIFLMC
ncbi:hypothetical protein DPMN_013921 [Dreissena polymorpha]|uniref:Uncharacterized protein n=1 Tax=Dreissena polymorpha TaxID=45954 RepID=A0A9D4N8N3_DREPO|nr:hypothetical protein DPMN_013921 [Dreissena polymorpha]